MVDTEAGYGDPEDTQTLVTTIDGTLIALSVDGHPLDLRVGELLHLRTGRPSSALDVPDPIEN